jgi:hypothetical protein
MRRILGAGIARPMNGGGSWFSNEGLSTPLISFAFHLVYMRPRKDLRQATSLGEMKRLETESGLVRRQPRLEPIDQARK